jgi:hypothetical protein
MALVVQVVLATNPPAMVVQVVQVVQLSRNSGGATRGGCPADA